MADLVSLLGPRTAAPSDGHEVVASDGRWEASLQVTEAYNEHWPSTWTDEYLETMPPRTAPRVSLAVSTDLRKWNYRYMFEKKGERSLELDNRLDDMGEVIRHAFHLTDELEDPSVPTQESIYTIGRICARVEPPHGGASSSSASEKLSQAALTLETSRMVGNGQRVPLSVDPRCKVRYAWNEEATQSASIVGLFPGMIIGLKGRNGSGSKFVAEELLMVRTQGVSY